MVSAIKQFTIRKLKEPTEKQTDKDIEWLCNSFGFITPRDQDKTALKILKALIKASKQGQGMTSEELTAIVKPSIGSVIYHLKRLIKAGLVIKPDSRYELRMNSLFTTIEDIEKDITATMEYIKKIAREIDEQIGIEHR